MQPESFHTGRNDFLIGIIIKPFEGAKTEQWGSIQKSEAVRLR